jgi:hypothetical protein
MTAHHRSRLRLPDLAFRIMLATPLLLFAVAVLHFASEEGVREKPRVELRLGAAVHEWSDGAGQTAYGVTSPGEGWSDEGTKFYASDIEAPGFAGVHLWETVEGERVYSPQQPGGAFEDMGVAFYAPASSSVPGSLAPYAPVYRWDSGSAHRYSTASAGLEAQGFIRGDVAFYAVCGDSDNNGVVDCLQ